MSNTNNEETKRKGRSKKSPQEIRDAFDKLVETIGLEGLQLFITDSVPKTDPSFGRSIIMGPNGVVINGISGTELVSVCERTCTFWPFATKLNVITPDDLVLDESEEDPSDETVAA